ncbi:bifunctional 2-keto-4-hydroxyglutarate aldolase/2-keto-3-deoxy-6-phosphogluconate aldolase [Terribacillus saccharophilus]|uniref:bifunctional 4-hydroxy-2-oxoglutarate aldolase/2-dehydro-3-deoxy-phosphogluconate aldolase n=1 Tax=Terribacillus saccharophilus TaxID=361277 RepID=UPI000BA7486D|nr:bifunctional 4-hydroxy-2-oxoglutarate aldolase/2-dehydro-3-deoxy-phosphogluconate aldolase [Terribacillus saccharophilus]PAF21323.1 bifunctional 2-keto-4-hydroxyglutarate aldolase/2-keto-3-deoxy-6-phosphogluconate aldolase [Terribacillus saccharophilus]
MIAKHSILARISELKVVAVIRGNTAKDAIELSKAAAGGGIKAIELTYTTPNIDQVFRELAGTKTLLGAGSVLDPETARYAILSGAQFIVSPSLNPDTATVCNRYGIPYLPGCTTIKEMIQALETGCDVIKLFPSSQFSPSFIRSINGTLSNVKVMPTGGVNLDNITEWLKAREVAVGISSDLNRAYQDGGYNSVELCSEYHNKAYKAAGGVA